VAEHGTVKWYSVARGYGFLVREATGEEVFFHHSQVAAASPLETGDRVSFEVVEDPKGLRGHGVRRADDA
jgi:cold shock protein